MRNTALALVLAAGAFVSACGGGSSHDAARKSSTPPGPRVAPLTGVATGDPAVLKRPALEVKVDNLPEVRPQSGLDAADVVFEELTEGGITRFLAIFQSKLPADVGPIRSVRAVDPALVTPLGGVFAFSGGTPPNVAAIRRAPVKAVDETAAGAAMHRDPNREPPHNLHGTPELLLRLAAPNATAPKPLFTYGAASRSAGAVQCPHFSITFSGAFFSTYDWAAGTGWLRSTPEGKFLAPSGKQIAPTNLVVLWVKDQSPEATIGRGDALILRDGTLARGTWDRTTVSEPFRLADSSGAALRLAPGTTWLHLALVNNATVTTCPAPAAP